MAHRHRVSCVLCQRSEETKVTGTLSTKDEVTAHQNCLLFSSGIYCRNSPQFDDLFGFSVEDVLDEVKRGSKLMCSKCKKRGATAGCEIKRCKKSYHYPCAVEGGAKTEEDEVNGKYGVYCEIHYQKMQDDSTAAGPSGCSSDSNNPDQSPVHSPGQHTTGPPPSPPPPASPDHSLSDSPSPAAHISKPEPGIDSTRFWKGCNAAGCTRVIFTDFITEMNDISSRIQSDQASQEDYDLALTAMAASGKLAELVTKQQEELLRKLTEQQKAAEAMKDVISALRR